MSFTLYQPPTLAMAAMEVVLTSLCLWTLLFLAVWASHEVADYLNADKEDRGDD